VPGAGDLSKQYGDGAYIDADLVVDSAGFVTIAGHFSSSIDFGGGPLKTAMSDYDIFVARLDGEGNHVWSRSFGDFQAQHAYGVAVGPSGSVGLTGETDGALDFGGGELAGNGSDIYVAKLDNDGAHVWSKRFLPVGGEATARGYAVAIDNAENLVLLGRFKGEIDVGGGPMTANANVNDYQALIAKYDPAGNHLWSLGLGDEGWQEANAGAVGAGGEIYLAGELRGSIDLGGGTRSEYRTSHRPEGIEIEGTRGAVHIDPGAGTRFILPITRSQRARRSR
jgi:hypothetical protein